MAKTTSEIKQESYNSIKNQLDAAIANGSLLSLNGLKKVIRDLRKRIKNVEQGVVFALSLEEVNKAELVIAMLQGQCQAYQERLDWMNERIKAAEQ